MLVKSLELWYNKYTKGEMDMAFNFGVSTACLYPLETEKALDTVCGYDVDVVEIFINSDCELEKGFLKKMRERLDNTDTKCVSLHPYTCGIEPMMLFTHYDRRFEDMLEYHKKYFEAMNILGAKKFILHGNKPENRFSDEDYFKRYEGLFDLGKSFGVTVTQENVSRCTGGNLDFLVKMKNALGDKAKFTLDVKQAVRKGYSPYEFIEKLGSSIAHVHLSDHNDKTDCGLVGSGNLGVERFLSQLSGCGFDGDVILELYRWGFEDEKELCENYRYLKSFQLT